MNFLVTLINNYIGVIMNYKTLYQRIIENRKENILEGYTENHHIIPRSLGGSDDEDNIVALSAREHFLCHYLLAKMYKRDSKEWYKMQFAFNMMKLDSYKQRYFNSRLYEALRKDFCVAISKIAQEHSKGEGNSQHGTMWICNFELKENKKIKKDDQIPEGWIKGRSKWVKILKERRKEEEKQRKKKEKYDKKYELAKKYWNEFHNGEYNSLLEYSKKSDLYQQKLYGLFKKYFKDDMLRNNTSLKSDKTLLR